MSDINQGNLVKSIVNAAKAPNTENLKQIIDSIPPNTGIDSKSSSILMILAENQCIDASLWYVMKYNPDFSYKNKIGENCLHVAINNKALGLVSILANNKCVEDLDGNGRNCIILAILQSDWTMLQMVIAHEVPIDVPDKYGLTAIAYAILKQDINIIKRILSLQISYNIEITISEVPPEFSSVLIFDKLPVRTTYLHLAVYTGNIDVLIQIVKICDDLKATDWSGRTALELAADLYQSDFVYILSSLGLPNPLFEAIKMDNYENFAKYLDRYSNSIDEKGRTPLHQAVIHNRPKMISFLSSRYKLIPDFEGKLPYDYSDKNYLQNIKNLPIGPILFGSYQYADIPYLYTTRFTYFVKIDIQILGCLHNLLRNFIQSQNQQLHAVQLASLIVQNIEMINLELNKLENNPDLSQFEKVINRIVKSNEMEAFHKCIGELPIIVQKLHDLDALNFVIGNSVIISWIKNICVLFNVATVTFGHQLYSITANLQRYLPNQNQIDDIFNSLASKGRQEPVATRKPYVMFRVTITESKEFDRNSFEWDPFLRERIMSLFMGPNEVNSMLPPVFRFVSNGVCSIIICEGRLIFISANSTIKIPLFGIYLYQTVEEASKNEVQLVFHAGMMKLKFDAQNSMKAFSDLILTLTKKYTIPELFFSKEESRTRPVIFVYSYIHKESQAPSIVLSVDKISKNYNSYDVYREFEKSLGMIVSGSLRCHPFQFPRSACSPSFTEIV